MTIRGGPASFIDMAFERYRTFIPDAEWGAFEASLTRREPKTLRVRTGRVDVDALRELLRDQGFEITPVEGFSDVLRVDREPFPISETLEHWLGLFYLQQASTCVAAPVLDPQPGEGVLDLCAAPGGKTTHLAELMRDEGCIVAVDAAPKRLETLAGNVARLGHTSILTVVRDGLRVPEAADFHRVLADVPCSGEGRSRKDFVKMASRGDLRRLPQLQASLLRKALSVTAPGGRVLYVTCTLAPEENEGVVDAVLRDAGLEGGVRLVPVRPDLPHASGVTRFEDARYQDELEATCRIHPHHLDSGGLFLALLERTGGPPPASARALRGWNPVGTHVPSDPPEPAGIQLAELAGRLEALGGARGAHARFEWLHRGEALRAHTLPAWPLESWHEEDPGVRLMSVGLRAFDVARDGSIDPAPDLLRWLGPQRGHEPGSGRLELPLATWLRLLDGSEVTATEVHEPGAGALLLQWEGVYLARGRIRDGRLFHDLPPPRARWLRTVLARRKP